MSSLRARAVDAILEAWDGDDLAYSPAIAESAADAVLAVIRERVETLRIAEPPHQPMPLYKEGANDMLNAVQALLDEEGAA